MRVSLLAALAGLLVLPSPAPGRAVSEDVRAPSVPAGLRTRARSVSSITIAWRPSRNDVGVVAYALYRDGVRVAATRHGSYTFVVRECGRAYTLAVVAVDAAGRRSARAQITARTARCGSGRVPSAAAVYWGAHIGNQLTGSEAPWDMNAVATLERSLGKTLSLIDWSLPWAKCYTLPCQFLPFPRAQLDAIRAHGSIPVFGWASYSQPLSSREPDFQLADVIDGKYDDFLRAWATAARAWGHPFFLRFDWEMNVAGIWPYSEARNGNQPGEFVRMWRHVHDIFERAGATNVTWVWCPNREYPSSIKPLARLYPGDAYVDWTCLDGYNWGASAGSPGWLSFAALFGPTYDLLTQTIAPSKPLMIAETASTEAGGSKAAWISDMLGTQLPTRFRNVAAVMWFDKYDSSMDWPLETSRAAQGAFASGVRSRYYAAAQFGALATSPIPPLR